MSNFFRIRLKMVERESLTSYLFRLAKNNETTFSAIFNKVRLPNITKSRSWIYLDKNPLDLIDWDLLSELTQVSKEELLRHTLYPIVLGISSQPESINLNNTNIYYDNNRRWFCPSCLMITNIFKLEWQIKYIKFCPIHKCHLQKTCSKCKKEQPYIGDHLINSRCCSCNFSLSLEEEVWLLSDTELQKEKPSYYFWESLFSRTSPIASSQFNLTTEQTICLKILFLSQFDRTKYNPSDLRFLAKNDWILLRKMVFSDKEAIKKTYLGCIVRFFTSSGFSLEQFINVRISEDYFQSFIKSLIPKDTENPSDCITPWCKYKDTHERMFRTLKYKNQYYGTYYCSGCFIPYGYHRMTGEWEEIGNKIKMVEKLLPHIYRDSNITSMRKDLSGKQKVCIYELIGYCYVHRIVPSSYSYMSRFKGILELNSEELLQKFNNVLSQRERSTPALFKYAATLYNWSLEEFIFYLSQSEVQQLLFSISNRVKESRIYNKLKLLLVEYLKECKDQNKLCSKKEFTSRYNIRFSKLKAYGLGNMLENYANLYQENLKKDKILYYRKAVELFVTQRIAEKRRFYVAEVYNELGIKANWLKGNSPELHTWIINQAKRSHEEMEKLLLVEKKGKLKKAIAFLIENDMVITKEHLRKMLGFRQVDFYNGSELSEYYNEIILSVVKR